MGSAFRMGSTDSTVLYGGGMGETKAKAIKDAQNNLAATVARNPAVTAVTRPHLYGTPHRKRSGWWEATAAVQVRPR